MELNQSQFLPAGMQHRRFIAREKIKIKRLQELSEKILKIRK